LIDRYQRRRRAERAQRRDELAQLGDRSDVAREQDHGARRERGERVERRRRRGRSVEADGDHAARERAEIGGGAQCLISRMICAIAFPALFEMKIWTLEPFETSESV
jgi:hypothetical protein